MERRTSDHQVARRNRCANERWGKKVLSFFVCIHLFTGEIYVAHILFHVKATLPLHDTVMGLIYES